jgi:predicted nucleic acid-binding Zn ribbon protein
LNKCCSPECTKALRLRKVRGYAARFRAAHATPGLHAERPCTVCGTPFIPRSSRGLTCSKACSEERHRRKARVAYKLYYREHRVHVLKRGEAWRDAKNPGRRRRPTSAPGALP